jgi:hypothetical protein
MCVSVRGVGCVMLRKQCLDSSDDGNTKIQQILEARSTQVVNTRVPKG